MALVITVGQIRNLIRESVLLNEVRFIKDDVGQAPVYRVVEIRTTVNEPSYKTFSSGWAIKAPMNLSYYKTGKFIEKDKRLWDDKKYSNLDADLSLVVNTKDKLIDLDGSWAQSMSRRPGGITRGQSNSYVIPHADTTYDNVQAFQKILKLIMGNDSRVDGSYRIINNPKYEDMTIDNVFGTRTESSIVKGGAFEPMEFYHGTSMKRYDVIKTRGLVPGKAPESYIDLIDGYSDQNVYLTRSVAVAENYATRSAVDDRSKAVVLKVIVKDPTKFVVDEDSVSWLTVDNPDGKKEDIHFRDKAWRTWDNAGRIFAQFQSRLAKGLARQQSIAYKGSIKPSDISVLHSYKPTKMKQDPDEKEYFTARDKTRSTLKKGIK